MYDGNNSEGKTKFHKINQGVIKELTARNEKKNRRLTDFFNSDEFDQLLGIIQKHDRISQLDLLHGTEVIKGLPADKFGTVCNTVYFVLESDVVEDSDNTFLKYHIDHKGIRFHLMVSQGSTYWTTNTKLG